MDDKTKYGIKIYNKVRGRKVILTLFFLEVYLKFLYNASINNKIKDLSEIKEHENNEDYINLFVYEEGTKYNYYKIGDLVFVHHYKYNNGNKGINHIFLIAVSNSFLENQSSSHQLSHCLHLGLSQD